MTDKIVEKMNDNMRKRLGELLLEKSYKEGMFTLTSGKTSDFYIDVKITALLPEGAFWLGGCFSEIIKNLHEKIDAVAGVTLGADPLVTATSMRMNIPALIIRKEPKGHGTGKQVEGRENVPPSSSVVLLEDVVTTGGTVLSRGVKALEGEGYKVAAIITVVDRQENNAAEEIQKAGYDFRSIFTRESLLALKN